MPDFKKQFPKHKPFECSAAWHLRKSGLYLAVYDLMGAVTSGGKNEFFGSINSVAKYFESDYETTRRVFKGLRKLGWIALLSDGRFKWLSHTDRAKVDSDPCVKRELLSWQGDTDPLVAQLYAASGGKLRVFENRVVGLRKFGSDEEILELFRAELKTAELNRQKGNYDGTSPVSCLHRAAITLKNRQFAK